MGPISQPQVDQREIKGVEGIVGWAGRYPLSPGESQCLRSGRGEDQRTGSQGWQSCALSRRCSASPCWSIGMRVYFCTMGGGGGHCTLLSPFRGPVDVAIFGTIPVIPVAELCPQ